MYQSIAAQAAKKHGINPDIFLKQIGAESGWDPNAKSPAGALGIAQFMPGTARGMGVDPMDPVSALDGAARYMRKSLDQFGGDYAKALAAYNAGGGAVEKYGGVPPFAETQSYVKKILGGDISTPAASPQSLPAGIPGGGDKRLQALMFLKRDEKDSVLYKAAERLANQQSVTAPTMGSGITSPPASVNTSGGKTFEQLLAEGATFGLKSQGDFQTTGGNHSKGSLHYDERAVDWGDANNSAEALHARQAYAYQNPGQFTEFYYDVAHPKLGNFYIKNGKIIKGVFGDHGDHIHEAR